MDHVRISAMNSQRFDPSLRRKMSTVTIASKSVLVHGDHSALSAKERAEPSLELVIPAWKIRTVCGTLSGLGIGASDKTFRSTSIIDNSCESSLYSSESNVCGFLPSHKQDCDAVTDLETDVGDAASGPYLPKSKPAVTRIFHALDCRRKTADFVDDSPGKYVPLQLRHDTETLPALDLIQDTKNETNENPFNVSTAANTVYLTTNRCDYEAGATYTQTIIRPLARSNLASTNVNARVRGMLRVRSLDCMRNANAFENDLDHVIQTHSSANAQLDLAIRVDTVKETLGSVDQFRDHGEEVHVRRARSLLHKNRAS